MSKPNKIMMRWMCNITLKLLKDRKFFVKQRDRLGIESIGEVLHRYRLSWFRHLERVEESSWINRCMSVDIERRRARGRLIKTWAEVLGEDLGAKGLR